MKYSLRVCVADDEPFMVHYLNGVLADLGHRMVAAARNGTELAEHCRIQRPDLIVTDIRMPGVTGIEAVELLCRESVIPAVFVTGYEQSQPLRELEGRCPFAILLKPFNTPELKVAINTAMDRFTELREWRREVTEA